MTFENVEQDIGYAPMHVHVVNMPASVPDRPKERRISSKTVVLNAANPFQIAVGVDPARIECHIEPLTNQVVMSHSISQAGDASNQANPYVNPNGRVLSNLVGEYVVAGGANEIWFTANVFPTLVGITIVREI